MQRAIAMAAMSDAGDHNGAQQGGKRAWRGRPRKRATDTQWSKKTPDRSYHSFLIGLTKAQPKAPYQRAAAGVAAQWPVRIDRVVTLCRRIGQPLTKCSCYCNSLQWKTFRTSSRRASRQRVALRSRPGPTQDRRGGQLRNQL
jgi:hypothetical protein